MSESSSDSESEARFHADTVAARKMPVNKMALAAGIAGAFALVGGTIVVSALIQPSAITRAGEGCSGSQPLDALFEELRASETPRAEPDPIGTEDDGQLDQLFDGVVSIEDHGQTLIVNTKPKDDDPLGITGLALDCVYEQLDVPTRITQRIAVTRALDGRQEGAWGDYTASWSYHPDSGANVIFVRD